MAEGALYCQVDTRAFMHPDWFDAGPDGFFTFMALDGQLRENPNAGVLPPKLARPEVLAPRVCAMGLTPDRVAASLTKLDEIGLIELGADGSVYLPKWEDRGHREKPARSDAQRKRDERERKRREQRELEQSHDPVTDMSRDVTDASVTGHDDVTTCHATRARARSGSGSRSGSSLSTRQLNTTPNHSPPEYGHRTSAPPRELVVSESVRDGPGSGPGSGLRSVAGITGPLVAASVRRAMA